MLRITVLSQTTGQIELRLAGRIGAEEADLLANELRHRSREGTLLVLDLDGIQFIEPGGLDLLSHWIGKGVHLRGGSPFVQKVLAAAGLKGGV